MEHGVMAPVVSGTTPDPEWVGEHTRHAEACGFDSIVSVEHAVMLTTYASIYPYDRSGRMELTPDYDVPDPSSC